MIQHKVSIVLERESSTQEHMSKLKTRTSALWQILIIGDVELDNPNDAYQLLEELQSQVDRIRSTYDK